MFNFSDTMNICIKIMTILPREAFMIYHKTHKYKMLEISEKVTLKITTMV